MRIAAGVAGVALLLALLTLMLLRGIDTNAPAYNAALQSFDDFALAEASLHRDILQARAGLLGDYDSLGKAIEAMEDTVARLRAHAMTEGLDTGPVDRLAATVAQQDDLTEQFKTSNALLQNSLSYVGLLSTEPSFGANDARLAPATAALAAGVLHLARNPTPDAVRALQERIDQFGTQAPKTGPDAELAHAILAHARLLHDLLPSIDAILESLVAVPSREPLEATRALFAFHQASIEAMAKRYRLLLYLASLLLVVALVRLGLRLRARALALRRRAIFERVIAENSTRLINCPAAKTTERLKHVLAELAQAIGVERAYLVLAENPTRVHAWCADGTTYPAGWPEQALALFARLGGKESDIMTVPDVAALPPGDAKKILEASGVRGWACVPLIRPGTVQGVMGFDSLGPAWDNFFPLPVVRLAGDAVANAIERESLERDRTRLMTRLERARRMQTIGSLATGIAHNFNNIIGAILGYSEMAEPQLTPGSKPAQHVDEIRRAAERGRDLIERILTFGRRRDGNIRPIQVASLLDEAATLLRATLPPNVELVIEETRSDVAVAGEAAQLQQVILNLCTNAAQAIEKDGRICVAAEWKEASGPLNLSHGELAPGRYVCISVTDTGRGFDNSVARRLFEPFFTTRTTGTGLGLATVHEIVRDHDGAMNVRSEPGRGSRFETWLPASKANTTTSASLAPLPLGNGETVLVIEAERERLLRSEEMLAALGYEPVGFERAAEAIAACRAAPSRFDAALINHTTSAGDGLDVARALHSLIFRPLLLATASTADLSVDVLAHAGIVEVVRRPLTSTDLAVALARSLRSSGALQT
jgi:signal transduction histidine kinase